MRGIISAVVLGLLAAACTTATPYQPYHPHSAGGIHGGYSDQRLAPDRYLVRFHGNSLTSRQRVEAYMLYRAAELTLNSGFDWFTVLDRKTEHNVRTIVRPEPLYRPGYGPAYEGWRPDWNVYMPSAGWRSWHGPDGSGQYDVRHIEAFEATAEIEMHRAPMPADQGQVIDARRVVVDLGPTIERPKA